jgi:hypothetical protein
MADDLLNALRSLANRWALKARDLNRDAKAESNDTKAAYGRGYAEGYYRAATELAALLKDGDKPIKAPPKGTAGAAPTRTAPVAAAPSVTYAAISVNEVLAMLSVEGIDPRDIETRKDHSFYAVFSKWQNIVDHERIAKIKRADNRVVILSSGRTKDTNDPFIEFAFKSS